MKIQDGFLLVLLSALLSCDTFPKDPDNTLEKVRNGQLLVGYSENPPWVIKSKPAPTGLEAELIKTFARDLQANIVWQNDTEEDLFEKLEKKELHLVIGGFTDKNSAKSKISFTRPYLKKEKKKHVLAVLKGENAFILQLEKFLHAQETKLNASTAP